MVSSIVRYISLKVIFQNKKKHCTYKPGSVPRMRGVCHLSSPQVTSWLKRSTLHRITRTGNPQTMVYMNLQPPVDTAQRSPAGWWSLTPPSHPYPFDDRSQSEAVIFFCRHLLSPIASTFRSGAPYAARTFLSRDLSEAPATNRCSAFSACKITNKFHKSRILSTKIYL